MKKNKANDPDQVLYNGQWIERKHFGAIIFSSKGKKLVKSIEELREHLASGNWFEELVDVEEAERVKQIKDKRRKELSKKRRLEEVKVTDKIYGKPV